MLLQWVLITIALLSYMRLVGDAVLRAFEKRLSPTQKVVLPMLWVAILGTSSYCAVTTGLALYWLVAGATVLPTVVVVVGAIFVYSRSPGC